MTMLNSDRLLRVVRIIVDSALIYTLSVFVLVAVNIAGSNALYPVSDMIAQLIVSVVFPTNVLSSINPCSSSPKGITFNLIIIRSYNAPGPETEDSQVHSRRESYRLPRAAFDTDTTLATQRIDKESASDGGTLYTPSGKDSVKNSGWSEQVLPVQKV